MPKLVATEEEYQEATLKWLKENPGKTVDNVQQNCQVTLENGKVINLGTRIINIKQTLKGNKKLGNPDNIDTAFWVDKMGLSLENKLKNIENIMNLSLEKKHPELNDKLIDSLIEKVEVNDNSFDWYIRCSKNNINDRYLLLSIDVTKEDILKHPSIKEEYRSLILKNKIRVNIYIRLKCEYSHFSLFFCFNFGTCIGEQ